MEYRSPFLLMKALETQLNGVFAGIDVLAFDRTEQKLIATLRRDVGDARLDTRDYELSETRAEQLGKAKAAKRRLDSIRQGILAASEYNVFSAIDVAQLTAQLEQITEELE